MSNIMASNIILIQVLSSYLFNPETPQSVIHNLYQQVHISNRIHLVSTPRSKSSFLLTTNSPPTPQATRPPRPVRPEETSDAPRQSEGFRGDVTVCCHHVDQRATITTRLLHDIYASKTISDAKLLSPPI